MWITIVHLYSGTCFIWRLVIIVNILSLDHSNAEIYAWISFFRQLFCYGWKIHNQCCLHGRGIPERWKVKEEESQPEECSGSIGSQVQDRISFSWINIHLYCYGWKIHNQFCLHGKKFQKDGKLKRRNLSQKNVLGVLAAKFRIGSAFLE